MDWEHCFRHLAAAQYGLVARDGLPAGCTLYHWTTARRTDRWQQISPRVLRLRGTPSSDGQRALAAVFDAGPHAALHGGSALAWHGMRAFDLRLVHVARERGTSRRASALGRLHLLRDLRAHDVHVVRGIPTETALRAIWSEASRFSPPPLFDIGVEKIGRLLDDAHILGLVSWSGLHELVDDVHRQGRAGSTIMRALADERRPGSSPTESRNEDRFEEILGAAGQRLPRRQVFLGGREPIGRCDFADDDAPVVFEINSVSYHSTPSDRAEDERRYEALTAQGFSVGVVWDDDLWSNSRAVVSLVRRVRDLARALDSTVLHSPRCPWPADGENAPMVHGTARTLPTRG